MPDPIAITHHSGCIEHPEHITTDALAALARSQGATEHQGQSLSEVARQIGPMCDRTTAEAKDNGIRKHLQALIIIEKIDLIEIARLKSSMVRHEALDQMMEVIPEAGKRELGAIAMAANLAHQMERTLGGEASTIVEHRVTGLPTFEQLKNEARAQLPDTHTSTRDLDNVRVIDATPQTQTPAP
jgi:hypothetical protein